MKNIVIIIDLFKLALEGQIDRRKFQEKWDSFADSNEFYQTLGADLDEAIAHTPYHLFKKQIDHSVWRRMREYQIILCDYLLLPFFKGDYKDWLEKRSSLIVSVTKLSKVNEKIIADEIRRIVSE